MTLKVKEKQEIQRGYQEAEEAKEAEEKRGFSQAQIAACTWLMTPTSPKNERGIKTMSTVTFIPRQAAHPHIRLTPQPHKAPMELAGRLLAQFEEDLRAGDNRRANLVNQALLELQKLMSEDQAQQVERELSDSWRRVCGWSF